MAWNHWNLLSLIWVLSRTPFLDADSSSITFWGKKVDFMGNQCIYWQLRTGHMIPDLENFSLCVDLRKQISTNKWTVFMYKQPGQEEAELALMGSGGQLQMWLFGECWSASANLSSGSWHSVCLTWSGRSRQLSLYVNGTSVLNEKTDGPRQRLGPNGTLTLGVSHGFVNGKMDVEFGTDFQGSLTLFRLWQRKLEPWELTTLRCVEGDVVRWEPRDWNTNACAPLPDVTLQCEWPLYQIKMNICIMCWDNATNETIAKDIVHHWLNKIFHANIAVHETTVSFLKRVAYAESSPVECVEQIPKSATCDFSIVNWLTCSVYTRVTPDADVSWVQTEIYRKLSDTYTQELFIVVENKSVRIYPVEAFPTATTLLPLVTSAFSTIPTTVLSVPTSSMHADPFVSGTFIPVSSHITPSASNRPALGFRDSFFRVNLNLTMSGDTQDPKGIILAWLCFVLPKDQMSVLNLRTQSLQNPHLERRTAGVEESFLQSSSYSCTFQVQVTSTSDTAEMETQIRDILKQEYTNGSITLRVDSTDVQISLIEPGSCPTQSQQTRQGFYVWPQRKAQRVAVIPCEGDPGHTATRLCELGAETEQASWTHPDLGSCPLIIATISDLKDITVSANNSMDVVDMISSLTANQKYLILAELKIVLSKLADIINVSQMTPPLGMAIITIIANIVTSKSDLSPVTNNILSITESVGNKISLSGDSLTMIAPAVGITILDVNASQFQGLSFGVSSILPDLNPEILINKDTFHNTVAFISLPYLLESSFPQHHDVQPRVQFHFYGTPGLFKDTQSRMELNTYVVSASVTNATVADLEQPVVVTLHHLKANLFNDKVECVYWDFSKNGELGGWESSGCRKNHTSINHTTCFCDHLTHFGVLLDLSRAPLSEENEHILTIISYLGCGVSSIFLGISLLTYAAFEKLRRDYPSKILINLSLALLGLNLAFLVNSWLASFESPGLCVSAAVTLHYFLLASFTWMGLEAVHMYSALVKVFNVYVPSYILKFCVLGWGVPLVIISLVLIMKMDAYGGLSQGGSLQPAGNSEEFCWLQDDLVFYVSVVAYVLLVLLCNASVFVVVLIQIRNMRANKPAGSSGGLLHDLRGMASLTFLLGLTWMMAFFTWGHAKLPLLYLFTILNSLQGFFIFLFHCLMKESVRKQWRIHLCCGRFRLEENSDWSQTGTVGVKSRPNQLVHTPSVKSAESSHSASTSSTSASSHSGRRLSSSRNCILDLVYGNSVVLPRAKCSSSRCPLEGDRFHSGVDFEMPVWQPREGPTRGHTDLTTPCGRSLISAEGRY